MIPDPGRAPERTALAWQRTGLTQMATGAAMLRLLPSSPWRLVLAVGMVAVGAVTTVGARRLHPHVPHRHSIAALGTWTLLVAVVATALSYS